MCKAAKRWLFLLGILIACDSQPPSIPTGLASAVPNTSVSTTIPTKLKATTQVLTNTPMATQTSSPISPTASMTLDSPTSELQEISTTYYKIPLAAKWTLTAESTPIPGAADVITWTEWRMAAGDSRLRISVRNKLQPDPFATQNLPQWDKVDLVCNPVDVLCGSLGTRRDKSGVNMARSVLNILPSTRYNLHEPALYDLELTSHLSDSDWQTLLAGFRYSAIHLSLAPMLVGATVTAVSALQTLPPCRAANLSGTGGMIHGIGGGLKDGDIILTNIGRHSCVLEDFLRIGVQAATGPLETRTLHFVPYWTLGSSADEDAKEPSAAVVLMRPGDKASVMFRWSSWCANSPPTPLRLNIHLPTGEVLPSAWFKLSAQDVPECTWEKGGSYPSTIWVSPFHISH